MKHLGKTEDQALGNLIRAYVSRPSNHRKVCTEFDPDLANAYIERTLTPDSRLRYEAHLSECGACRKNVVALFRLAGVDTLASAPRAGVEDRAGWLAGLRQAFGSVSAPQWAMAAVAVIVVTVSVPLFLSKSIHAPAQEVAQATAESQPTDKLQAASPSSEIKSVASAKAADTASSTSTAQPQKQDEKRETTALARNTVAAPSDARTESAAQPETKPVAKPVEAGQVAAEGQVVAQAPAPGASKADESAKNDSDQAQKREKDAAQSEDTKLARADTESTGKEKARKSEPAAPPATSAKSEAVRGGKGLTQPPKLALRDPESVRLRVTDRKVGSKKFWLKDNTWTDRDFDPDRDLPVVTIIRDSNVYNELLTKRAGLKVYLTEFRKNERAVFVYRSTVYKLIPQQGEN